MTRAVGAEVAHFPDTEGVTSSNLVSPHWNVSSYITHHRVIGAAASALPSHGRGHRFDSYITHHRAARRAAFFCWFSLGFRRFVRHVGNGWRVVHAVRRKAEINPRDEI